MNLTIYIGRISYDKSIDEMTQIFTERFLEVMSRNIPNKVITCNDKDAPWITNEVKTAIKRRVHRKLLLRDRISDQSAHVRTVQNENTRITKGAERNHLGEKRSSYDTGFKLFWTTFKRMVNKKKLTNIPSLVEGNSIVSDFQQKANIFNYYFSNQCSLNDTSSTLPSLYLRTEFKLFIVNTSEEKIFSIIWSLNSKKAHGHDSISINV